MRTKVRRTTSSRERKMEYMQREKQSCQRKVTAKIRETEIDKERQSKKESRDRDTKPKRIEPRMSYPGS